MVDEAQTYVCPGLPGKYVQVEDYQALAAERDALQEGLARTQAQVETAMQDAQEEYDRAKALQDELARLKRATQTVKLNANAIIDRAKRDFAGVSYEHDAQAILAAIKEWNGE